MDTCTVICPDVPSRRGRLALFTQIVDNNWMLLEVQHFLVILLGDICEGKCHDSCMESNSRSGGVVVQTRIILIDKH